MLRKTDWPCTPELAVGELEYETVLILCDNSQRIAHVYQDQRLT